MKLLVTGGAGFIGSHYVRSRARRRLGRPDARQRRGPRQAHLRRQPREPRAGRATTPRLRVRRGRHPRPRRCVDRLMAEADAVVHFAAETHVDRSILGAADFVMTNVRRHPDPARRRRCAHGVDKFVHVSTDEVYGSIDDGSAGTRSSRSSPTRRTPPPRPSSDLLARAYHRTHGLPVCITRCSNNYGPYQFPEKVIPLFVTNLIDGAHGAAVRRGRERPRLAARRRPLPRHPPGARAAAAPGEVYNIGGGTELTNKELTGLLLEATGTDWDRVEQVDRPARATTCATRSTSPRSATSSATSRRSPFEQGLADTVEWYRDQPRLVGAAQGAGTAVRVISAGDQAR